MAHLAECESAVAVQQAQAFTLRHLPKRRLRRSVVASSSSAWSSLKKFATLVGKRRAFPNFHQEYGLLNLDKLLNWEEGYDSVKLETGFGVERVVYDSEQVEVFMVRACDATDPVGQNDMCWTSDWELVEELREDRF